MPPLELHVCWGSWSADNSDPVFEKTLLTERSMSVFLKEFVGVEVFPGRFSAGHKEQVIPEKTCGVHEDQDRVDEQCERYTPFVDGPSE